MFGFARWIAAGSVGGLVGAAVWAGITYATNYEVGYVAWGIGFLVGFCVRFAAGESEEGFAPGVTAAVIALAAVLGGKYAAVHLLVSGSTAEFASEATDQQMVVASADELIREKEAKGEKVIFPSGKTLEDAESKADYPPSIWNAAEKQWNALGSDEQTRRKTEATQQRAAMMNSLQGAIRREAFAASFGIFDALWFFLAAGTAYRLGHGNTGNDE
jgi:hypothetical protein